jgi:hypothetical protein
MQSCENCALFLNGCPGLDGCDFENCGYKPDYPTLEAENAELKLELETHKRALYLTTRAGFFERMEHPCEDDIQAEIDWFLGIAKRELTK